MLLPSSLISPCPLNPPCPLPLSAFWFSLLRPSIHSRYKLTELRKIFPNFALFIIATGSHNILDESYKRSILVIFQNSNTPDMSLAVYYVLVHSFSPFQLQPPFVSFQFKLLPPPEYMPFSHCLHPTVFWNKEF